MANRSSRRRERDIASRLSSSTRAKLSVKLSEVLSDSVMKMGVSDTVYREPVLIVRHDAVIVGERHSALMTNAVEVELPHGFTGVHLVSFYFKDGFVGLVTDLWFFLGCLTAPEMRAADVKYAQTRVLKAAGELMKFIGSAR